MTLARGVKSSRIFHFCLGGNFGCLFFLYVSQATSIKDLGLLNLLESNV